MGIKWYNSFLTGSGNIWIIGKGSDGEDIHEKFRIFNLRFLGQGFLGQAVQILV